MRSSSAAVSIVLHLVAVLLMALIGSRVAREREVPKVHVVIPLQYSRPAPDEGGGGQRDPLPASKGELPPPAGRVFVPPMVTISQPRLAVTAGMMDAPEIQVNGVVYGDPLGAVGPLSGGPGTGDGIGPGKGTGVGPGEGPRVGGQKTPFVEPAVKIARFSKGPELIFKVEPEYPDEARKARYQGVVVLQIEVDPAGHTRHITLVRGLGLGMDENAIAAVKQWRFRPALDRGTPVAAAVIVEVAFRLL